MVFALVASLCLSFVCFTLLVWLYLVGTCLCLRLAVLSLVGFWLLILVVVYVACGFV